MARRAGNAFLAVQSSRRLKEHEAVITIELSRDVAGKNGEWLSK